MPIDPIFTPNVSQILHAGVVANYKATSQTPVIVTGGQAQLLCLAGEIPHGLYVQNPAAAADQGISTAEKLNVDWIGNGSSSSGTQVELQPGDPPLVVNAAPGTTVYVRAATTGHKFYAFVW